MLTPRQIGAQTALPYLGAAIALVLWSRHPDRSGERVWHLVAACLLGALGFLLASQVQALAAITLAFLLATSGIYAACVIFWTLPRFFPSGAAAAGVALAVGLHIRRRWPAPDGLAVSPAASIDQ